ncbi:MAG TPA: N-6 DNA methylase [Gemmatimonadaceae bacterium]|nr:N-6 DNA methylase [Gemmatimonadaceae bacterium]
MSALERNLLLLHDADSFDGVSAILRELHFGAPSLPLDASAARALGLPADVVAARITAEAECLRALTLQIRGESTLRDAIAATAHALSRTAPQFLWIICGFSAKTHEFAIACWSSTPTSRVRVASMVCETDKLRTSDAETLSALTTAGGENDLLRHSRWLDVLGREAITRRFFTALERVVEELAASLSGRVSGAERRELALIYISRLLFLSFLETRGWLDGDFGFLANGYSRCVSSGGRYQRRVLEPLFFGTLNTRFRVRSRRAREFGRIPFLNGGLFARSYLERIRRGCEFADDAFGSAFGNLLSRYRFTGREDSADWSEASIDPEILGKTFEALMAARQRKTSGAFYTPQQLVEDLASQALASVPEGDRKLESLRGLKVLDPACGSGAFLVHMLERIASLRRGAGEAGSLAEVRRRVLTTSIFGVDLNPMAVWLCELRLWLSIVIESDEKDPMQIAPLPNLDRHIRVGDSLAGGAFDDPSPLPATRAVVGLRARYSRAVGPRKRNLARRLDRLERGAALDMLAARVRRLTAERKELLLVIRSRDLFGERHPPDADVGRRLTDIRSQITESRRRANALRAGTALPFSFAAHFSDVAAARGFDIVVGNPPWVRVHNIDGSSREQLRCDFAVYRNAAWETGAQVAGAGRGFAAQIDMSALFVERSWQLLRPDGTMALILPSKLWQSLAGAGLRKLLLDTTEILSLVDLSDADSQFDAAVYPSLLVARRDVTSSERRRKTISVGVRSRSGSSQWPALAESLAFDSTTGSPWLLLPPRAREAFDAVVNAGVRLHETRFGRPLLGVKTGHNRAYMVRLDSVDGSLAHVTGDGRTGIIERELLRPLIRGETLHKWRSSATREHIVWTHDSRGQPRRELPPHARRWLAHSHDVLGARSDLHGRFPWWTIFRTESARADRPRVVWADFGLTPRALVVERGTQLIALNTCYVVHCDDIDDAFALASILNSQLAAAWLNAVAEPARGGYRRYLGWTVSLLPIPREWARARDLLAPLGRRATEGDVAPDDELLRAVLEAYRLDVDDIEALLSWTFNFD